jgi:uncharacterized membrane protein
MASLARWWRHLTTGPVALRRRFPPDVLSTIDDTIIRAEAGHRAELRVVLEAALEPRQLLADPDARDRALELFASLGMWDTEANNGVLIYVLLADRRVEIVADRGYNHRVLPAQWDAVCRRLEADFAAGEWSAGCRSAVVAVSELASAHFPLRAAGDDRNEISDRTLLL